MEYQYVFFLGSHPDLSATECWSALRRYQLSPRLITASTEFLIITLSRELPADFINRLGGTDRIARVTAVDNQPWDGQRLWTLLSPTAAAGKITVGISTYELPSRFARELGSSLKRAAQQAGARLRFITPSGRATRLNGAQVMFNQLHRSPNVEVTILKHEQQWYVLTTVQIQNIVAYEARDTGRPARDAKVGMLPPKLAQIMLNLAITPLPLPAGQAGTGQAGPPTILDPFCGMGTIIQEGWLMGYRMHGSDTSPAMVAAATQNIAAVQTAHALPLDQFPPIEQHDVRQPFPRQLHGMFDAIVTEPYLGRPLNIPLTNQEIPHHLEPLAELYLKFFENARALLAPHGRILFLLPAFRRGKRTATTFTLFPDGFLDAIRELGYSAEHLIPQELTEVFPSSPRGTLLYARPKALVGRELTLWTKE